jgi:DNA-binding winged helix-turn-helix (wHTH) protein
MNVIAAHSVLHFDRFSLDFVRGCLRAGEQDIELRPKSFEVLCYLVSNAGRLVAKQELLDAIWPNVIVTGDSISQCIRELRAKLGDSNHSLIKTVSRRGYLLNAAVSAKDHRSPKNEPEATRPEPQRALLAVRRRIRLPVHQAGAWAVIVAAAFLVAESWAILGPDWALTKSFAQLKPEKLQTVGQFDGIWRAEFANNEFCTQKIHTTLWSINQGVVKGAVKNGKLSGTLSGTGELRVTWPALIDPALTNVGSAKLEADRGVGKWDGQQNCGGAFTLARASTL